jgi:hypothetical protein
MIQEILLSSLPKMWMILSVQSPSFQPLSLLSYVNRMFIDHVDHESVLALASTTKIIHLITHLMRHHPINDPELCNVPVLDLCLLRLSGKVRYIFVLPSPMYYVLYSECRLFRHKVLLLVFFLTLTHPHPMSIVYMKDCNVNEVFHWMILVVGKELSMILLHLAQEFLLINHLLSLHRRMFLEPDPPYYHFDMILKEYCFLLHQVQVDLNSVHIIMVFVVMVLHKLLISFSTSF